MRGGNRPDRGSAAVVARLVPGGAGRPDGVGAT
jgi:hypothetical protein